MKQLSLDEWKKSISCLNSIDLKEIRSVISGQHDLYVEVKGNAQNIIDDCLCKIEYIDERIIILEERSKQ